MEYFADIKYRMLLNQRILAKGYPQGDGYPAAVKTDPASCSNREHGRISWQSCDVRVV